MEGLICKMASNQEDGILFRVSYPAPGETISMNLHRALFTSRSLFSLFAALTACVILTGTVAHGQAAADSVQQQVKQNIRALGDKQ